MSNEPPPISGMGSQAPQDPVRVEPIGYYSPGQFVRRPGILTALAIVSIVVAALGLLSNCISVFSTAMLSNVQIPVAGPATSAMSVAAGSGATTANVAPLSTGQTSYGPSRLAIPNRELAMSAFDQTYPLSEPRKQMLRQLLDSAGDDPFPFGESNFTLPKLRQSITSSGPVPGDESKQFYIAANGRIEVSDADAIFISGQGNTTSVSATSTQAAARTRTFTATPGFTMTSVSLSMPTISGMIAFTIANFLLAGFLLYVGIRALQDYPRSRVLYMRYAAMKYIAVVITGVMSWIWTMELYGQMSRGITGTSWIAPASVVVNSLLGAILPTAVLIVMSTRSIKAYYGTRITELQGSGQ